MKYLAGFRLHVIQVNIIKMVSYWQTGRIRNKADVDRRLGWNQSKQPVMKSSAKSGTTRSGGAPPPRMRGGRRIRGSRGRRRVRRIKKRGRKSRARKSRLSPVNHSKRGVAMVYEVSGVSGGTDDDAEVVYIGHCNMPADNMIIAALRAIIKSVFFRFGITIRNFSEIVSAPGTFTFFYYPTSVATTVTSIPYTVTGTSTYNDIVGNILNPLKIALDANPGLRPYSISYAPTTGVRRDFYTDSITLNFSSLSRLKIQNRTPNEGGTDAIDTNDVNFLVGSVYSGSGTGTYIKAVPEGTPFVPLIGTDGSGRILKTRTDNMTLTSAFLRHPPETTKFFTRVSKCSPISKFAPGDTKFSTLYTTRKVSFAQMLDMYLKDVTSNSYSLSTMGQFRFFGLQKFIDDDAAVKVKIAYEVELQIGCTCMVKSNVYTHPVYIETTEA